MNRYTTKQGDVLDDIVFRFYGDTQSRTVERVLEANRGLANYGPIYPVGLTIILPTRPVAPTRKLQTLWE